jgi:hypothetical protein
MTTPALQAAVRRAYAVFGGWPAPGHALNVCTYCCMSEALEREMRSLALEDLSAHHFFEYCTGAMGDMTQPADEVRYLLPRWLELVAAGEETHHSVELTLDRLGRCAPGTFTAQETGVLDEFMLALFDHHLDEANPKVESSDPLALIIMAEKAGLNVAPLLQHWTNHAGLASTVLFVRSTYWEFWPEQQLSNAFAGDCPQLQAAIKAWLMSPATKAAFSAKLLQPEFLALVERTPGHYTVPLALMVEAVFEHLSA